MYMGEGCVCVCVFLEPVVGKPLPDLETYLLKLPEDPCLVSRAVMSVGFGVRLLNLGPICAVGCLTLNLTF